MERNPRATVGNLLFFGRLTRGKGLFDAMAALGAMAARGVDGWTLRVYGQGNQQAVREAAAAAGIAARVEVYDAVGDRDLERALAWADIAILPSHFEAFGLAFAEAQAAGLPVIAYRAGSVPEVVEDGRSGWLAPLRDIDALAARIEASLADPDGTYRAGLTGRVRIAAEFRWESTAATILAAIDARRTAGSRPAVHAR